MKHIKIQKPNVVINRHVEYFFLFINAYSNYATSTDVAVRLQSVILSFAEDSIVLIL